MATVTVTMRDTEDGGIKITMEFGPPTKKGEPMTQAQQAGMALALELAGHPQASAVEDEYQD